MRITSVVPTARFFMSIHGSGVCGSRGIGLFRLLREKSWCPEGGPHCSEGSLLQLGHSATHTYNRPNMTLLTNVLHKIVTGPVRHVTLSRCRLTHSPSACSSILLSHVVRVLPHVYNSCHPSGRVGRKRCKSCHPCTNVKFATPQ